MVITENPMPAPNIGVLTLYYDGQCPLCLAEIHALQARNHRHLLKFVDVSGDSFEASGHGLSCTEALATMHGRIDDGAWLSGPAVFCEAYRRAGLPLLAWLFSRPWLAPLLGIAYRHFARHRHAVSRLIGPSLLRLARWRYR